MGFFVHVSVVLVYDFRGVVEATLDSKISLKHCFRHFPILVAQLTPYYHLNLWFLKKRGNTKKHRPLKVL
jgi:hypothetical protein